MRLFSIGSTKEGFQIPKAMFIIRWMVGRDDSTYVYLGFISPFWIEGTYHKELSFETTEGRYRNGWYFPIKINRMHVKIGEDEWKQ